MQTNEKNIVEQVADVADVVTSAVVKKKWTIKRVMLYVVTLYFVFLILKFVFKVIFKVLDLFRAYIHDLTDRHKMSEVFLWTLAGVIVTGTSANLPNVNNYSVGTIARVTSTSGTVSYYMVSQASRQISAYYKCVQV